MLDLEFPGDEQNTASQPPDAATSESVDEDSTIASSSTRKSRQGIIGHADPPEQTSHFDGGSTQSSTHGINKNARGRVYLDGEKSASVASSVGPRQKYGSGGRRGREPADTGHCGITALDKHLSKNNKHQQHQQHREDASGVYSKCSSKHIAMMEERGHDDGNNHHRLLPSISPYGGYNGDQRGNSDMSNRHKRVSQLQPTSSHNRVKFADQSSKLAEQVKAAQAAWREYRSVSSNISLNPSVNTSIGSGVGSSLGSSLGGSVVSEYSSCYSTDNSSFYSSASLLNHRIIRQYDYVKKNAILLAIIAALALVIIVRILSGSVAGRQKKNELAELETFLQSHKH